MNLSEKERALLKALYAARGLRHLTAADVRSAYPETFAGGSDLGIHRTADSLVRKGLAGRDRAFSASGRPATAYHIREAGWRALLDAAGEERSGG